MIRPRLNPAELMRHVKNSKLFDKVLDKVNILSMENGNGLAEFTVAPEHTNALGHVHNGFLTSVADYVSSFSFSTHQLGNNYHVSIDMQLCLYSPEAKVGDKVEVCARTLRGGHSVAFLEVLMKNKSTGDLLAKANHNMFIIHPREKTVNKGEGSKLSGDSRS